MGRRGFHIVENYDFNYLFSRFDKIISSVNAETWDDVIKKLYFFAFWEYE